MQGLAPGDEFGGYTIEAELGRGGMGVVYAARQAALGRRVALKVVAPQLASDPTYVARFQRESRLAASVEHPNVVPVYEAGEHDGALFIAMRYVPGEDLRAIVRREGRLEPRRVTNLLEQIAAGLDAAHAAGLVHRDVTPANVLVTRPDEQAYLTDFGLARQAAGSSGAVTDSRLLIGTPDYMAPERFRGDRVDARSDIYSLAVLLCHLLEGRPPFAGHDAAAKGYAHVHESPPALTRHVPPELDEVIRRGMAKSPDDRYLSAGDLAVATRAASEGLTARLRERSVATGEAAPTRSIAHRRGRPTRRRALALLAAVSLAVGASAAVVLLILHGDTTPGRSAGHTAASDHGPSGPKPPPIQRATTSAPLGGSGTVTEYGEIGSLSFDLSKEADVRRAAGPPERVADGSFEVPTLPPYRALGYGCKSTQAPGLVSLTYNPGKSFCKTAYYISAKTHALEAFFTSSPRFKTREGVTVGTRRSRAERLTGVGATSGCHDAITLGESGGFPATLLIELAAFDAPSAAPRGEVVTELSAESNKHNVGLQFC